MIDILQKAIDFNSKFLKFEQKKEYILVLEQPELVETVSNVGKKLSFKAQIVECNNEKLNPPKLLQQDGIRFLEALKSVYPNGLEDSVKVSITKVGDKFQTQWIIKRVFF